MAMAMARAMADSELSQPLAPSSHIVDSMAASNPQTPGDSFRIDSARLLTRGLLPSRDMAGTDPTDKKAVLDESSTQVHVTTLDAVVSVNSFFTVAVFVGLSLTTSNKVQPLPGIPEQCAASEDAVKTLLVSEVVSFSCFLFSSLVAQGLKLFIVFSNSKDREEAHSARINNRFLRFGVMASACGSIMGSLLLMISILDIIRLRLGNLSCYHGWAIRAAIPLIFLVSSGITVFLSSVFYAFLH